MSNPWDLDHLPEPWKDVEFNCDMLDDFGCKRKDLMDDLEAYKTGNYMQGFGVKSLRERVFALFPEEPLKAVEIIDYYNLPDAQE